MSSKDKYEEMAKAVEDLEKLSATDQKFIAKLKEERMELMDEARQEARDMAFAMDRQDYIGSVFTCRENYGEFAQIDGESTESMDSEEWNYQTSLRDEENSDYTWTKDGYTRKFDY